MRIFKIKVTCKHDDGYTIFTVVADDENIAEQLVRDSISDKENIEYFDVKEIKATNKVLSAEFIHFFEEFKEDDETESFF